MGSLRHSFVHWLSSDYAAAEFGHLSGVRFKVGELRLPGRRFPDLISIATLPTREGFSIMLDLWKVVPGMVREGVLAALAWDLVTVETCYESIVEAENRKGRAPAHLLIVTGNIVGSAADRSPGVSLVAETGKRLRIWTYKKTSSTFEAHPYCDQPRRDPFNDIGRTLASLLERETKRKQSHDWHLRRQKANLMTSRIAMV